MKISNGLRAGAQVAAVVLGLSACRPMDTETSRLATMQPIEARRRTWA